MKALTAATYTPHMPLQGTVQTAARWAKLPVNGYALLFTAASCLALATAGECSSVTHLPSVAYGALLWLWWAVIATALWKLSQRSPSVTSFAPKPIALHLLAGTVLAGSHLFLLWASGYAWPGWNNEGQTMMWRYLININRFGIEVLLYAFIFAIVGIARSQLRGQQQALRSLELERQLAAAHLQALQMQLEPHFLFNTLNAITTHVELGRQQPAAEMLTHLNAILKSTLHRSTPEKVPLAQELEIVSSYLAIEQVRFADRLRLEMKVDPGALDGLIPCFLLQPIVENAIRHGIAYCEADGLIEASAKREGNNLQLRVRDTGAPGRSDTGAGGHGIGLQNTRDRLAYFYPECHAMTARPLATGGFEVAITIPYEATAR